MDHNNSNGSSRLHRDRNLILVWKDSGTCQGEKNGSENKATIQIMTKQGSDTGHDRGLKQKKSFH